MAEFADFPKPPRLPRELAAVEDWMSKAKDAFDDRFKSGEGAPEGVIAAQVGAIYQRTDGGAGTSFYVKESGDGVTGWAAK